MLLSLCAMNQNAGSLAFFDLNFYVNAYFCCSSIIFVSVWINGGGKMVIPISTDKYVSEEKKSVEISSYGNN